MFMKVLALLLYGDSSYKLLLHFFLSSRSLGFLFAVPNFTACVYGTRK